MKNIFFLLAMILGFPLMAAKPETAPDTPAPYSKPSTGPSGKTDVTPGTGQGTPNAHVGKNKPAAQKENWLKDQDDQTDTYAIPLDTSEEEEKQELKSFERKPSSRP